MRTQKLRTWLVLRCEDCGDTQQVPTVFRAKTAEEKYLARRKPQCTQCGSVQVTVVACGRIQGPMRAWVNAKP